MLKILIKTQAKLIDSYEIDIVLDKYVKKEEDKKIETTPVIERARQEREAMDAANKKKEELLDREEAIMAKRALGGETLAGSNSAEKPKEETPHDYRMRVEKEMAEGKTEFGN